MFGSGGGATIDLSVDVGHGVFAPLADEAFFRTVHIGQHGQIAWTEDIEVCPDAPYQELRLGNTNHHNPVFNLVLMVFWMGGWPQSPEHALCYLPLFVGTMGYNGLVFLFSCWMFARTRAAV